MAKITRERLADQIYVRVEADEDPPFLVAGTTKEKVTYGLDDGDVVELAEYRRVRFLKVKRGTVEMK